jgi:hypothetical protein
VETLLRFCDLFVDLIEQALLEAVDHHHQSPNCLRRAYR